MLLGEVRQMCILVGDNVCALETRQLTCKPSLERVNILDVVRQCSSRSSWLRNLRLHA
jgi:hypothetical protein